MTPSSKRQTPAPEARDHSRTANPSGRIFRGDYIRHMRGMPSRTMDFFLTDPPYITRYRNRSGRGIAGDDNADWLAPAFAEMFRLLKPGFFCVGFYGWNKVELFMGAWQTAGFHPVGHMVFRNGYASKSGFPTAEHEAAYLLAKGGLVVVSLLSCPAVHTALTRLHVGRATLPCDAVTSPALLRSQRLASWPWSPFPVEPED